MDKLSKEKVANRLNIENYAIKPTRRKIIAKKVIDIQQKEYIKQKFLGKDSFSAAIAAGYPESKAKFAEQQIETFAVKETLKKLNLDIKEVSWIRGDPAMFTKGQDMSMSIADQFARAGNDVRIQPASNDRVGGWTAMHQWLSIAPDGKPYWMICENCTELIRTLPSLVYDDNKIEDLDGANIDHWADAERYALKHIQWIDGKSGSILHRQDAPKILTAVMYKGKQLGIDLDKFSSAQPKKGVSFSLNKFTQ